MTTKHWSKVEAGTKIKLVITRQSSLEACVDCMVVGPQREREKKARHLRESHSVQSDIGASIPHGESFALESMSV